MFVYDASLISFTNAPICVSTEQQTQHQLLLYLLSFSALNNIQHTTQKLLFYICKNCNYEAVPQIYSKWRIPSVSQLIKSKFNIINAI